MDDAKIWAYLIIGGIYLLSRLLKKGNKNPSPAEQAKPTVPGRVEPVNKQPKGLTFEELLRQITETKAPPEQQPVVDYDDSIEEEVQDVEVVNYDSRKDNEAFATYEEAKKQAFSRPSLEESMKVGDTVMSFGKFKEFEEVGRPNLAAEYLKGFGDLDSIRKAVVMSEILKRKF